MIIKSVNKNTDLFIKKILSILSASIFIAIASQLSIPLEPVPFTFQTLSILIITAILGSKLGIYSVLTYLFEGCIGIPVFANLTSGIQGLLSPTGGYLFGFLPAVYIAGIFFDKSNKILNISIGTVLSLIVIFVFGYLQLSNFVGFKAAYILGVNPFIITESIKALIAILLINKIKTNC